MSKTFFYLPAKILQGMCFCALLFCIFPVVFTRPVFAEPTKDTLYEELLWENLLPESVRGGNLPPESITTSQELDSFLKKRNDATANQSLQGKDVKIYGFVVPLERDDNTALTEFLLVPYFGACIHVPPPPQNQIIHVTVDDASVKLQAMDTVFVYGTIGIEYVSSSLGDAAYTLKASKLEVENPFSTTQSFLAIGLTLLCGVSICLGWVGPFANAKFEYRLMGMAAAFAAGAMTSIGLSSAMFTLSVKTFSAFLVGAGFMLLAELLVHAKSKHSATGERPMRAGPALAVALHNFPECFIVFSSAMASPTLGLALGGAMIAHNIPLGISIGLSSGKYLQPRQARLYAAIAGFAPPLFAILAYFFMRSLLSVESIKMLLASAGGALVFIALAELLPFARKHGKGAMVSTCFAAGASLMLLVLTFSYRNWQ